MNQPETGIARRYLELTRYHRRAMGEKSLAYPRAPLYKEYPDAASRLSLDPESVRQGADLWQCLAKRRSQRDYLDRPLTREEVAALLWATQGITGGMGGYQFRASPSAWVSTSGSPEVTRTVCSKWAERRPSTATAVHPLSSTRTAAPPSLTIGSMASICPALRIIPCPAAP